MIDNLFYSSMSSVLSQWSDFRVSKHLYKAYFNMKKSEKSKSSDSAENDTRRKINYKNSFNTNNLSKLSDSVSSSVSKLSSAFEKKKDTGEIDMDKAYAAAEDFVKSYNDLVTGIRSSGDKTISAKHEFISNMANAYSKRLANVGITIGSDGKMSINKDDFKAASEEDLEKIFGKKNSFAEFMNSQASYLSKYTPPAAQNKSTYTRTGSVQNTSTLSSGQLLDMIK